jgi:hypothetical protein
MDQPERSSFTKQVLDAGHLLDEGEKEKGISRNQHKCAER